MERLKGKWIGTVVLDCNFDSPDVVEQFEDVKRELTDFVAFKLERILQGEVGAGVTVTVTKLHAELHRDEPINWTKEA